MSSKIRIQADEFYNSHLVLKQNDEALIDNLEKLNGKPLVMSEKLGTRPTMGVHIVCLAFALELYIKDLHLTVNDKAPRGHDILKLFEGLPEDVRQQVFEHKTISQNPCAIRPSMMLPVKKSDTAYDGFIQQIKLISDGFVKWRYSYEAGTLQYNEWFAVALIKAIASVTDDLRADFYYQKQCKNLKGGI